MNTPLMSPEISSLSESFTTRSAVEVLLSRMNLHVCVYISFLSETLATDLFENHKQIGMRLHCQDYIIENVINRR